MDSSCHLRLLLVRSAYGVPRQPPPKIEGNEHRTNLRSPRAPCQRPPATISRRRPARIRSLGQGRSWRVCATLWPARAPLGQTTRRLVQTTRRAIRSSRARLPLGRRGRHRTRRYVQHPGDDAAVWRRGSLPEGSAQIVPQVTLAAIEQAVERGVEATLGRPRGRAPSSDCRSASWPRYSVRNAVTSRSGRGAANDGPASPRRH